MSEYQEFYKFLEGRPTRELSDCIHKLTDMVASRAGHSHSSPHKKQKSSVAPSPSDTYEATRVKKVMKDIELSGFQLPHGMNGYNKSTKKFVRFLSNHNYPVSAAVASDHGLKPGWFLDKTLSVYLNWNPDGYYEMSRKDSLRFNITYTPNKYLFVDTNNGAGDEGSRHADKRKGDNLPQSAVPTKKVKEESLLWFSDSNGSEDDQRTTVQRAIGSTPSISRKSEEDVEREVREELQRVSATASASSGARSPTKAMPIKGDSVYILRGSGRCEQGRVVGQLGTDPRVYTVEIAGADGVGQRTVKVPVESLSFSNPAPALNPTPSSAARKKLKRQLTQEAASTSRSANTAVIVSAVKSARQDAKGEKAGRGDESEDSLDEFFNNLSQRPASAASDAGGSDARDARGAVRASSSDSGNGHKSKKFAKVLPAAASAARGVAQSPPHGPVKPAAAVPAPASAPAPVTPVRAHQKQQATPQKLPATPRSKPAVPALRLGDRVIVLKGEFHGQEAVVAEQARAGEKLLPGIFRVAVQNPARSTVFMPAEFLKLLPSSTPVVSAASSPVRAAEEAPAPTPPAPDLAPSAAVPVPPALHESAAATTTATSTLAHNEEEVVFEAAAAVLADAQPEAVAEQPLTRTLTAGNLEGRGPADTEHADRPLLQPSSQASQSDRTIPQNFESSAASDHAERDGEEGQHGRDGVGEGASEEERGGEEDREGVAAEAMTWRDQSSAAHPVESELRDSPAESDLAAVHLADTEDTAPGASGTDETPSGVDLSPHPAEREDRSTAGGDGNYDPFSFTDAELQDAQQWA
jgi:ribosomal protein L24